MGDLHCMLHEAAHISRNRPALLTADTPIHFGEFDLMVSGTAIGLRAVGIGPGDRVALYIENGWMAIALIHALIRVQAVVCPLNTRWPSRAVRQHLDRIHARYLIARVRDESRNLFDGITCLDPDGLVSRSLNSGQGDDAYEIGLDQPATILFTSGSGGTPKAALATYGNHYYSAVGVNRNFRLDSRDCWLLSLPLYHAGGLGILFRSAQSGAAIAVPDGDTALEEALQRFPVTHLSVVSMQLQRLLDAGIPADTVRRLKAVVLGGGPVSGGLVQRAREGGWPVFASYGLTEMNTQVTACAPGRRPVDAGSSGTVLPYRELRIAADGEIMVRGPVLFSGYIEQDKMVLPLDAEGWFSTGDLGVLDGEGELIVKGRKDDLIISGGENIQPEEIEMALCGIDGVRAAVVVSRAHVAYGRRPVAFVERVAALTDAHIRDALEQVLPRFKIPDEFLPWPDEPLSSSWLKPDRRAFQSFID